MAEEIKVKAILLVTLYNFSQWVNGVPRCLPPKKYKGEKFLFLDKNGNELINGEDFMNARDLDLFPVNIYRLQRVTDTIIK